jgi:hypothetical protein
MAVKKIVESLRYKLLGRAMLHGAQETQAQMPLFIKA